MDRDFFWLPGWVLRSKTEERALIAAKVAEDRWLMDGTGSSTFDLRLPRADAVIWVRLSRMICIWGVIKRTIRSYGRERLEMARGCPERLDWEFMRYVWNFEHKETPKVVASLKKHGPNVPVFQLKTRCDMRALLDLLGTSD
jgi:adenylate kinase family enzyme